MKRMLLTLGITGFLSIAAWAQDESPRTEEAEEAETTEVEAPAGDDAEDAELDEQGFVDEDDDFRPSEDIPADQSIAFPTDI
ncbi:MAG: hypothetical protein GWN47_02775 [Woeseiaceae bacterium]|nr:hypothetical protein [Woeseiaceae bacterium]